jgi:hypothetical protein
MKRIEKYLRRRGTLPGSQLTIESYESGVLQLRLPNGRKQRVTVKRQADRYVFTSTVLGSRRARAAGLSPDRPRTLRNLAEFLWRRNHETDVVRFEHTRGGRILGRIEQIAKTADEEEITFYITRLAQECDRLEYLVTGQDQA